MKEQNIKDLEMVKSQGIALVLVKEQTPEIHREVLKQNPKLSKILEENNKIQKEKSKTKCR